MTPEHLQMNEELKPCPICKSTDIRIHMQPYFSHETNKVMCWGCGLQTPYMPNNEAIKRWNNRNDRT
jgi:hypothetical protein